jgi:hypothetical protein
VQGINASIELIRRTRGSSWPTEPVSVDFGYVDEIWHECEFREGGSFTYAVYDSRGQYPGCCYLYPMGRRTPLTEELLTYDVDVSWWGHARRRTGAATRAGPPGPRARSGRASSLRPRIDIAATVYPTSGRRRDGGVESSAGLSASTSSSMKITS